LHTGSDLRHFFMHSVEISDDRRCADDVFAVKDQHDPKHPVCGGVLWAHIDDEGLFVAFGHCPSGFDSSVDESTSSKKRKSGSLSTISPGSSKSFRGARFLSSFIRG